METNDKRNCRNCSAPMSADDLFCPKCSQKYTTGRVPFFQFLKDFIQHYFNLDSRFFRTLTALFIPGKLTKEYFLGKHKSYANPIQLFLVPAFFLFALVSWNLSKANLGENAFLRLKEDMDWLDFYKKLDRAKEQTDSMFTDSKSIIATDTLTKKLKAHYPDLKDSFNLSDFGTINANFTIPTIAKEDLLLKSADELVEMYGKDRSFVEKTIMRQSVKFRKGGHGILDFFISKLSIILLLMMPVLALILKLFYVRRGYFYVEHLVFTLHFHAFVFTLCLLLGLLGRYMPAPVLICSILAIFIYLFLAMKNVYQQGFGKTMFKFIGLLFSYIFLATCFSVVAMVFSFLLF